MKLIRLLLTLLLPLLVLAACGARSELAVYHAARGSLVNPNFPAYSFEYPSAWGIKAEANHITFVSEAKLLKDVPEKLEAGQIIAELSLNTDLSPQEMIDKYTSALPDAVQFKEAVSFIMNGHPAAYQEGTNPQTGDQMLVIATDIGENRGSLITARIAGGELEIQNETLMRIAQSLQMEK